MKLNLYNDWLDQLATKLSRANYDISNIDRSELPYKYFNALNKKVTPVPRRVIISKELYKSPNLMFYNKYLCIVELYTMKEAYRLIIG